MYNLLVVQNRSNWTHNQIYSCLSLPTGLGTEPVAILSRTELPQYESNLHETYWTETKIRYPLISIVTIETRP